MRRRLHLLALLAALAAGRGEIIDRIVATVGERVITASDVEREMRITAFLNGEDLSPRAETRRRTTERLIEQTLIRREMDLSRYPSPEPPETEPLLEQVRKQPRFSAGDAWRRELARYGVAEQDLREHLRWQLAVLRFIEYRFRTGLEGGNDPKAVDQALDAWLKQARTQARIRIREEAPR